jgi:hypothetical protein
MPSASIVLVNWRGKSPCRFFIGEPVQSVVKLLLRVHPMIQPIRSVTLCGQQLSGPQHICAFFDSRDEQYEILNPYFREGLDNGEEVVTIVESAFHDEHLRRMRAGGVAVDATAEGQLKLLASEGTYARDGVFVVERMYALLEETLRNAQRGPYGRVRTCELMMYEAQ